MPITVRCSCGKNYKVADKLAGKKFKCKSCEKVLAIRRPAAPVKAKKAKKDQDSGFLEMDLDSEYSQMAEVERPQYVEEEKWDLAQERDYRFPDGDPANAEPDSHFRQHGSGVERTAAFALGGLGIVVGLSLIGVGIYLRVYHGWRVRLFFSLGIASLFGGVGFLWKGL